MTTVNDIERALFEWAPRELAAPGDRVGLQAGERYKLIRRVLIALDVTQAVITEAVFSRADVIVTHHPILRGEPYFTDDTDAGTLLLTLCQTGLAVIAMHTNLDATPGGINDKLSTMAGLEVVRVFDQIHPPLSDGQARLGRLPHPLPVHDFAERCKNILHAAAVRFYDTGKPVHSVGLCAGSGGSVLEDAVRAGCDTFLTGELKHNHFLTAHNLGVNIVECGHFATENIILTSMAEYLTKRFPNAEILLSEASKEPYQCL